MADTSSRTGRNQKILDSAVATGAGDAYKTNLQQTSYQVEGITTATVVIQVSNDGTNFIDSGLSFTADGVGAITGPFAYVRANVTVWTTGTINVTAVL